MPALATVTSLTAKPGVQQIKLTATVDDPNADGLPYLAYKDVEFTYSPVNDRDDVDAEVIGTERLTMHHPGRPEEVTGYYCARTRFSYVDADGTTVIYYGDYYPSSPTGMVPGRAIGMSGLAFGMANGQLEVSVNGDLLLEVTDKEGNAPSADSPIYLAMPSFDTSIGGYEITAIKTPLSKLIGDGSTMGVPANNTPFRLWVVMVPDGGTQRLGLVNLRSESAETIGTLDESHLITMINGGSDDAGDSVGVIYGDADIGPAPFRIIGSLTWEDGLPTVGHWDTAPFVELSGRGSKKPGEVAHVYSFHAAEVAVATGTQYADDTIPTDLEGTEVASIEIFGHSKAHYLDIDVTVPVSIDITGGVIASLCYKPSAGFDGSPSICAAIGYGIADQPFQLRLIARVRSPGPAGLAYAIRLGPVTPGSEVTMNGIGGSRILGGALLTKFTLTETVG